MSSQKYIALPYYKKGGISPSVSVQSRYIMSIMTFAKLNRERTWNQVDVQAMISVCSYDVSQICG